MDEGYTARMDQALARMRETARLAAAFYKGLVAEDVPPGEAVQITAIYAVTIQGTGEEEETP